MVWMQYGRGQIARDDMLLFIAEEAGWGKAPWELRDAPAYWINRWMNYFSLDSRYGRRSGRRKNSR